MELVVALILLICWYTLLAKIGISTGHRYIAAFVAWLTGGLFVGLVVWAIADIVMRARAARSVSAPVPNRA